MPEQQGEPDLIARSRKGELAAFNTLVERHQTAVYNLCLRMMGAQQPAEDATQEAFIAAFRRLEQFRGGSFRSWVFRIAANACYDEMRRRRARPAASLDEARGVGEAPTDVAAAGLTLDDEMERRELGALLQRSLLALPADQRLAVILCDVQGMDYAEIAVIAGASLGTVKSRISRGRARLREVLQRSGELLPARFRLTSEERDDLVR
jgi:RNA polymerase sigma-70 factor (ECF subfamily)